MLIYDSIEAFRIVEKMKRQIKNCFKINDKQSIKMPKKDQYIKLKNFGRKTKSPFLIYADFEKHFSALR